jgi:integration host factor subunit beta
VGTVTKQDLVQRISDRMGQKKITTKTVIQEFIDEIIDELEKGNRLEFREFGVFELKERAARKARNPQTGDTVYVPAKVVVHFKPGRKMKALLQQESVPAGARAASPGASPAK